MGSGFDEILAIPFQYGPTDEHPPCNIHEYSAYCIRILSFFLGVGSAIFIRRSMIWGRGSKEGFALCSGFVLRDESVKAVTTYSLELRVGLRVRRCDAQSDA